MSMENKVRTYAKRYGFSLRRMPHSQKRPNGYVSITDAFGKTVETSDMVDAYHIMMSAKLDKSGVRRL